jgi:hypothetical protein
LRKGGVSKVLVDNTGNVGIGLSSGIDRALVVSGAVGIYGAENALVFKNTSSSNKSWSMAPEGNNLNLDETGLRTAMTFIPGGNVGIGTKTAPGRLSVQATDNQVLNLSTSNSNSDIQILAQPTSQGVVDFWANGGTNGFVFHSGSTAAELLRLDGNRAATLNSRMTINDVGSGQEAMIVNQTGTGQILSLRKAGANKVLVDNAGNVGINKDNPSFPLHVGGAAKIEGNLEVASIKTSTWSIAPDYVFEKDYKLATLDHVEKFVKENKHLPDVPSAKEFKKEGMDLAEMNFTLLRKVEELTLYVIELKKEVNTLKAEKTSSHGNIK